VVVPDGTDNGTITLTFPVVPANAVADTYARFRISTTSVAQNPVGSAPDGEVEDYRATIAPIPAFLDADGNGRAELFTDGILIARYILDFTGTNLVNNAIGSGATRTTGAQVREFLDDAGEMLDADGNGATELFTDGILIARFLVPITGANLIRNAIGSGATRTTAAAISAHLSQYLPPATTTAAGARIAMFTANVGQNSLTSNSAVSNSAVSNSLTSNSAAPVSSTDDTIFADIDWIDDDLLTHEHPLVADPALSPTKTSPTKTSPSESARTAASGARQRSWLRVISGD